MGVTLLRLLLALAVPTTPLASNAAGRADPAPVAGDVLLFNDGQRTAVMQDFSAPLGVTVVDAAGHPVPNVLVFMTVEFGSAMVRHIRNGDVTSDVQHGSTRSDANGFAVAVVTAGAKPGPVELSVRAVGDPELTPAFGAVSKYFNLRVDPPSWPSGEIPDTGSASPRMMILAGLSITTGLILLTLRRRPSNRKG